jgi:hypothetical protein
MDLNDRAVILSNTGKPGRYLPPNVHDAGLLPDE